MKWISGVHTHAQSVAIIEGNFFYRLFNGCAMDSEAGI